MTYLSEWLCCTQRPWRDTPATSFPMLLLALDLPSGYACGEAVLITQFPFREEVQAQVIKGRRDWEVGFIDRQLHSCA